MAFNTGITNDFKIRIIDFLATNSVALIDQNNTYIASMKLENTSTFTWTKGTTNTAAYITSKCISAVLVGSRRYTVNKAYFKENESTTTIMVNGLGLGVFTTPEGSEQEIFVCYYIGLLDSALLVGLYQQVKCYTYDAETSPVRGVKLSIELDPNN